MEYGPSGLVIEIFKKMSDDISDDMPVSVNEYLIHPYAHPPWGEKQCFSVSTERPKAKDDWMRMIQGALTCLLSP